MRSHAGDFGAQVGGDCRTADCAVAHCLRLRMKPQASSWSSWKASRRTARLIRWPPASATASGCGFGGRRGAICDSLRSVDESVLAPRFSRLSMVDRACSTISRCPTAVSPFVCQSNSWCIFSTFLSSPYSVSRFLSLPFYIFFVLCRPWPSTDSSQYFLASP